MKEITAGAVVRRYIRRYLLRRGISFKEDKGWIDSVFLFDCSDEIAESIKRDFSSDQLLSQKK